MPTLRGRSIRSHILWMVLVGAILPLALVGAWLTASAIRAGKSLLEQQLTASLQAVSDGIRSKWAFRESDLLLLADNEVAHRLLGGTPLTRADSEYLQRLQRDFAATISTFSYRDVSGRVRWSAQTALARAAGPLDARNTQLPTLSVSVPAHDAAGRTIGSLDARVTIDAFVPTDSGRLLVPGSALAVRDRASGAVLRPLTAQAQFATAGESIIDGANWMSVATQLQHPPLDLVVGAPTAPYVTPFARVGRIGFGALAIVVLLALSLSVYLTARIASPLEALASASAAVARGDLNRRVHATGPAELETLTASFNAMTESLRRSMDELSRRSALAAVGEFAASLAHEVRNALTSVRLDLQRAEEKLPPDGGGAELVSRSVVTVTRLDATVTGALRVARSGNVKRRPVDLRDVLSAAARDAAAPIARSGENHVIEIADGFSGQWCVNGDADALHQLFLNLLLNAVQALKAGASGRVRIAVQPHDEQLVVTIEDNGVGIPKESLERVFEPFFTTRQGGTGLGLSIARQVALAHGGDVALESGTTGSVVTVKLPR